MTVDPVRDRLTEMHSEMIEWRHHLHQRPELAFAEHETASFIAELLRSWGIEVHEGIAGTGVVGVLGPETGVSVGLRADMDALPVHEDPAADPVSQHPGVMHACGHDGHMTMLLGAARFLSENPPPIRTVLIFQPAEENEGGAAALVADGLFDRFPVDQVYGLHNVPGVPCGTLATRVGPAMAAFDTFELKLIGTGGHSSMPEQAPNPIRAAALLTTELGAIAANDISPFETATLSVCSFQSGETYNVIPDSAHLKGSLRYFDAEVGRHVNDRIRSAVAATADRFGLDLDLDIRSRYPVTINHPTAAENAAAAAGRVLGQDSFEFDPLMGSEDFSELSQDRPGAMSILGIGDDSGPLHSPTYRFNDDALVAGAEFWIRVVSAAAKSLLDS